VGKLVHATRRFTAKSRLNPISREENVVVCVDDELKAIYRPGWTREEFETWSNAAKYFALLIYPADNHR